MTRRILVFFSALGLSLAAIPRPLADIPIQMPNGTKINVKTAYRGKVVLVALISTTCKDCLDMVTMMGKLQRDLGPRGFVPIAAAFDDNAKNLVGPWAARYRPQFAVGYLERNDAVRFADIPSGMRPFAPILIFVDRKGQIKFQAYGDDPIMKQKDKAIPAIIDSLLKNQEGPMSTTQQVGPDGKPVGKQ